MVNQNNKFIAFTLTVKPVINILSTLFLPLLIIGIAKNIASVGELLLYLLLSFLALHVVTLPAEFKVSSNALKELNEQSILNEEELNEQSILNEEELYCAKKVLNSTALFNIIFALTTPTSYFLKTRRR